MKDDDTRNNHKQTDKREMGAQIISWERMRKKRGWGKMKDERKGWKKWDGEKERKEKNEKGKRKKKRMRRKMVIKICSFSNCDLKWQESEKKKNGKKGVRQNKRKGKKGVRLKNMFLWHAIKRKKSWNHVVIMKKKYSQLTCNLFE